MSPATPHGFDLRLTVSGDRIAAVTLSSHRPLLLVRRLEGLPVAEALAMAGLLLPLCGQAQTLAATRAVEQALGIPVPAPLQAAREWVIAIEQATSHAWRLALDWPDRVGLPRELAALGRIRQSAQQAVAALGGARLLHPGCPALAPERSVLTELIDQIAVDLDALALGADALVDDLDALEAWIECSATVPARLLAIARKADATHRVRLAHPALGWPDARWFGDRLGCEDRFGLYPDIDGRPAEAAGALPGDTRLLAAAIARRGQGAATRVLAQWLAARQWRARATALIDDLREIPAATADLYGSGTGTGIAATVRGPVAHHIQIERGIVTRWRTVAPTEWNCHPEGPLVHALSGARGDPQPLAQAWIAALDPCAPVAVTIES
jgi:coenzyme F420-reducing hydrogenase alpha subunit